MTQAKQTKKVKPDVGEQILPIKIEISRIIPNSLAPQEKRRKQFNQTDLLSLGNSIKLHGLRQPILVRPIAILDPKSGDYEIVFGERRWLASQKVGLKTINAFVENLTDAQVIELQYEENEQHAPNSPLTDAFYFAYLKNHEGYTVDKITERLNKSKKEVTERLRLNDLIPEAVKLLETEQLPLKHAYYLAKFPSETQKTIIKEGYCFRNGDENEGASRYQEFKEDVEENIIRDLNNATFDTEDERLHLKGLKCSNCPDNSAFTPLLFENAKSQKGLCLNPKCHNEKTNINLRLQREAIAIQTATIEDKPVDEMVKVVPLVTEKSYVDKGDTPFKEKVLTNQQILEKPECDFSVLSLAVKGEKKGRHVYICQNQDCPVHHPKRQISKSEAEKLERNFNEKIKRNKRLKVFTEAIEWFDDSKPFWMFDDLVCDLLEQLWWGCGSDIQNFIGEVIQKWKKLPKKMGTKEAVKDFIRSLDKLQQTQMLFLFCYKTVGYYFGHEDEIVEIAKGFTKLDLIRVDADLRVKLAPPEFKPLAEKYLDDVIEGKEVEPPNFWAKESEK